MHDNRYTQTVDKIKAPEGAIEKTLETARNYGTEKTLRTAADVRPAKKTVSRRTAVRYAVAAALALAVALGAILSPGLFGGKAGRAFSVTVHAAELAKDSPVYIKAGSSMNVVGRGDSGKGSVPGVGGTEYYVALPFAVKGENVVGVTWSVDRDAIALICTKNNDPVTAGDKVGEGFDTVFDRYWISQAEKAGTGTDNALSRKYTSVTLNAAQASEGLSMALVGTSSRDSSEFYGQADKNAPNEGDSQLAKRADSLNGLIGTVIHCSVTFADGSTQQLDIQLGFAVMSKSSADPAAFAGLSAAEKAEKDSTGVFVVYSIAG